MRAVLLATTPGAKTTVNGETVAARLARQLRAHGASEVTMIARSGFVDAVGADVDVVESAGPRQDLRLLSERAASRREGLVLVCADTLAPDTAISTVMSDPTSRSGALTASTHEDDRDTALTAHVESAGRLDVAVHRDRGMVLSTATEFHTVGDPNAVAVGLLRVSSSDLGGLQEALRRLAEQDVPRLAPEAEAWRLTLLALARGGEVKLTAYATPGMPYARVPGNAAASGLAAAIAAQDEDAVRLRLCVKSDDDLFATYCISSYSRKLVTLCARIGLTPVGVTWLSILFALIAAGAFAQASLPAMLAGAAAMYVSFTLDCVDGQLARYTHQFSAFGGWLDMIADRGKEYLLYAGLAVGASAAGLTWAWPLAIAAITLQTTRHMTDTWYGTLQDEATRSKAVLPLTQPADRFARTHTTGAAPSGDSVAERLGRKLGVLSAQFASQRRSPAYWFKRTVVFPVGERWLVMAVFAAVGNGRIALAALLIGQLLAFAYTLAGRTLRSWAAKTAVLARADVDVHRDDVLLPLAAAKLPRRLARRMLTVPPLPVLGGVLAVVGAALAVNLVAPSWGTGLAVAACLAFFAAASTMRHRHAGALDWLTPAMLRAGEFGLVAACGMAGGVPAPLVYALLAMLALYHYDLAARVDKAASPLASRLLGLGWDGRVAVLLIASLVGPAVWWYAALTAYIAIVFVAGTLAGSRSAADDRPAAPRPALASAASSTGASTPTR